MFGLDQFFLVVINWITPLESALKQLFLTTYVDLLNYFFNNKDLFQIWLIDRRQMEGVWLVNCLRVEPKNGELFWIGLVDRLRVEP